MTKQAEGSRGSDLSDRMASVRLPVPTPAPDLFKHKATNDVLGVLVDAPYETFTIRELSRLTDHSTYSVKSAVDVLEANGLVVTERAGNRRPVRIDRTRLEKPDDPILRIPQVEYHEPVRAALARLHEELDDVRGVLVFGSVARGQADRQSDIDLWVLVGEASGDQHRANEIAKSLGQQQFDGDRYEFQILVESLESARGYQERLAEVFTEGITLHDSAVLQTLRSEVSDSA
jgi:predicted nucleotidyltransferase